MKKPPLGGFFFTARHSEPVLTLVWESVLGPLCEGAVTEGDWGREQKI